MQEAQKAFKAMLERKCMLTKTLKDQVNQIQEMTIMHLVAVYQNYADDENKSVGVASIFAED